MEVYFLRPFFLAAYLDITVFTEVVGHVVRKLT
jgi:hypothetical protein